MQKSIKVIALLWVVGSLSAGAYAQAQNYPNKPITMTVGYGAGGGSDVASRMLARLMEKNLGQSIVVQNKPGAQATINVNFVASAPSDGYTVGSITMAPMVVVPHMISTSYKIDDLKFIGGWGRFSYALAVKADSPYKNVQDVVEVARKRPMFFSAAGAPNNIGVFDLGKVSGAKFEQVLYKSGTDAAVALASGDVELCVQPPGDLMAQVDAGKITVIGSISASRASVWPDIPTVKEQGFNAEIESWMGLAVPAKTPDAIVNRLEEALAAAVKEPEFQESMKKMSLEPIFMGGRDYTKLLKEHYARMEVALKDLPKP